MKVQAQLVGAEGRRHKLLVDHVEKRDAKQQKAEYSAKSCRRDEASSLTSSSVAEGQLKRHWAD